MRVMQSPQLSDLPVPPAYKVGWPWTQETNPKSFFDKFISYPKITIVTPSYNQGHFIEETIRSLLLQGYPNLEYIIIDGGSTDKTVDIIKKYEPWVTYWISEPDNGQSTAINKGLARCTGDIFNWLNSDDFLEPGSLLTVGKFFAENEHIQVVCGREYRFEEENPQSKFLGEGTIIKPLLEETICLGNICQPSTFFKKSVIDEIGLLSEELNYLMDCELWTRYLLQFGQEKIIKVDQVFSNYRLHNNSKTVSKSPLFFIEKKCIDLSLLSYIQTVPFVINKMRSELTSTYIKYTRQNWNISSFVNKNLLSAWYCKLYITKFYYDREYQSCKAAIKYCMSQKLFSFSKSELLVFIKTFLINRSLLNYLRNIKTEV